MYRQLKHRRAAAHFALILPTVALGVLAMIHAGVSPMLWGQQVVAAVALALLAPIMKRQAAKLPIAVWCAALLALPAVTLLGQEAGGAKRWLALGPISIHAAELVLPALLVTLCRTKQPYAAWFAAAVVLCFQPDLSQLAAFSAAALPLLWRRKNPWSVLIAAAACALFWHCSRVPVTLESVPYCEGILTMLGDISWILKAAGWIALGAVPVFFACRFAREKRLAPLCLCIYYLTSMLFILTGEYPVPFMGYGFSSIAGFWLAFIADPAEQDSEKRPPA